VAVHVPEKNDVLFCYAAPLSFALMSAAWSIPGMYSAVDEKGRFDACVFNVPQGPMLRGIDKK